MGSWIENFQIAIDMNTLYPSTAASNFISVAIFGDRDAKTKGKPLNSRANVIILACGVVKLVHGDIFLARTYDNTKIAESPSEALW